MAGLGGAWMLLASTGMDRLATLQDRGDWPVFAWLCLNEVLTFQASIGAAVVVMREYPNRKRT